MECTDHAGSLTLVGLAHCVMMAFRVCLNLKLGQIVFGCLLEFIMTMNHRRVGIQMVRRSENALQMIGEPHKPANERFFPLHGQHPPSLKNSGETTIARFYASRV